MTHHFLDRAGRKVTHHVKMVFIPGLHIEDRHEQSEKKLLEFLRGDDCSDLVVRVCHAAEYNKVHSHELVSQFLREMHIADIAVVIIHQKLSPGQLIALTVAFMEMMPVILIKDSESEIHVPDLVTDFLHSSGMKSLILQGKPGDEETFARDIYQFSASMIERTAL